MDADLIIIGSGIGGATLASALAPSGLKILVVEKGHRLRPSPEARDDVAVFIERRFASNEQWMGSDGVPFIAGNHYVVGGNSKFFGAVMYRFRERDFHARRHIGGVTPSWPLTYADLEPWYDRAERLFEVRGTVSEDITEPSHRRPYPHLPVPDEAAVSTVRKRLLAAGLHPASLPLAINIEAWLAGGKTGWDAFPNTGFGKIDAESGPLTEALKYPNVSLQTGAEVLRLETDNSGKQVQWAVVSRSGQESHLTARAFAVAAGAVQSAALLLRSTGDSHPNGLANRSDQVGRNFMNHNSSGLIAIDPSLRNTSVYQKTLSLNDYYEEDPVTRYPLGNVQSLGRLTAAVLKGNIPSLPMPLARLISAYAFGWFLQSEDLPRPESRVTIREGKIIMNWVRSNIEAHELLIERTRAAMKRAGFPIVLVRTFDRKTTSHQCGTARLGKNPSESVVDLNLRSHDVGNLWITDASVLPTSAAVNPALTIAALVLRAAPQLRASLQS